MPKQSQFTDLEYHLRRARSERGVAYRLGDGVAADAHMRLSALHLGRALLLQTVRTELMAARSLVHRGDEEAVGEDREDQGAKSPQGVSDRHGTSGSRCAVNPGNPAPLWELARRTSSDVRMHSSS